MGIRDTARKVIDTALPPLDNGIDYKVITSNGATAADYTRMTGLSQSGLEANWAKGGIMTGCNGFTGFYGVQLGFTPYLGRFDLEETCKKAGKADAWIRSTDAVRPKYGDILRHASFHVDVALDFDGPILWRAAGGQGGKRAGCDIIKRVKGKKPYDPKSLVGWIDIEVYAGEASGGGGSGDPSERPGLEYPLESDSRMAWLHGWWSVSDGNQYYYCFSAGGRVQWVSNRPAPGAPPSSSPGNTGTFSWDGAGKLVLTWSPRGGGQTVETFTGAGPGSTTMRGTSNRYAPLIATKI